MWFLLGCAIGIALGYLFVRYRQSKPEKYLSMTEYWVYLPGEKLPPQDEVMSLLLQGNSPVGPGEGLLLSDIRLHVALVLRSKNAHVFRPDLFDEHIEPTADVLRGLAECQSIAKIRYISEIELPNDSHLQLLPYLAYAYAKLGDGKVVYDCTAEKLLTVSQLAEMLKLDRNARRPDVHLQTIWRTTENGGRAETRGLVKKGIPELVTADVAVDERLLVTALLSDAAERLWNKGKTETMIELESFSDRFQMLVAPAVKGKSLVRILRVQST